MSTQELRLRYFLQLASNIGVTAKKEAAEYERSQQQMSRSTQDTQRHAKDLDRTLTQLASNTSVERQVRYFDRLADSVGRAKDRAKQLKEHLAQGMQNAPELIGMGTASYYGAKTVMAPPVRAFADLEEATIGLKTSMLEITGKVDGAFGSIAKKAEELGNKLPGTTKDFFSSANELIRQGVPAQVVADGGLEASAKFGVLMKMNQGQAATTIAKVREAYGLGATELPKMADLMQRASYSSGIAPQDFLDVARYAAPTYNTMKLTGLDNARKLLAVQGIAAGVGLESTSFGTNFAQMLSRLSQVDSRVAKNSPDARAVKALLDKHKISMSFYGADGEFSGVENMFEQLAKLRGLSTLDKQHISKVMFGDEAGRPAQIMIDKGLEAYREQLAKMDNQASLDQRLDVVLSSLSAKLESLAGTVENVMARMAAPLGTASKPAIDSANGFFGKVGGFFEENPVASTVGLVGLGLGAAAGAWRGSGALFGLMRGMGGLRGGGGASMAPAAAAVAAHNPFRGLGVTVPPVQAAPSLFSRLKGAGRFLGPGLAAAGFGVESYDVITDEQLTTMGKVKGVSAAAGGAAGAWAGAKGGAALGSLIMPGFGTVAGGLIGGAAGYMIGKSAVNWAWGDDPERDFVKLTAPNGQALANVPGGGQATLQIGEGVLRLDVHVRSDGSVGTNMATLQPMQLLRVESGSTDPGSFAGMGGR